MEEKLRITRLFLQRYLGLCGAILLLLSVQVTYAKGPFLSQKATVSTLWSIDAIAISADEYLVAAAVHPDAQSSVVFLYDRQQTKVIAKIDSPQQRIERLWFHPYQQYLFAFGDDSIEVWNLEEFSGEPGQMLDESLRVAELDYRHDENFDLHFDPQQGLMWNTTQHIMGVSASPQNAEDPQEFWRLFNSEKQLTRFAPQVQQRSLALGFKDSRLIEIYHLASKERQSHLDYHSFPVVQLQFVKPNILLSLDTQKNLIWGHTKNRVRLRSFTLDTLLPDEVALGFNLLQDDQFIAIHTQEASKRKSVYITDQKSKVYKTLRSQGKGSFAVSPTGRYIVNASHPKQWSIYQLAYHQKPEAYVQELKQHGASNMARRFYNHLEVAPNQFDTASTGNGQLEQLLQSFRAAEAASNLIEAEQWLQKMKRYDAKHPAVREAEQLLNSQRDHLWLQQGKKLVEEGQIESAIRTLAKVPQQSLYRQDSRKLIAVLEAQIQFNASLENAESLIRRKNWASAEVVLKQLLEQDPENERAKELLGQVQHHNVSSFVNWAGWLLLGLISCGLIFLVLFRNRKALLGWASFTESQPAALKKSTLAQNAAKENPSSPEKAHCLKMLQKAKQMIVLAKEADTFKLHTGRLIDFEAEISAIARKASQRGVNYPSLTADIMVILQTLRGLKYDRPKPSKEQSRTSKEDLFRSKDDKGSQKQEKKQKQQKQQKQESSKKEEPKLPNFYEILGIKKDASAKEIKKAYHQKIKEYHPDKHQSSDFDWVRSQAAEMTKKIQEAYDILSDAKKRRQYDQKTR